MAIWPATLPQSPMGMASVELQDSRIRSQVDQGPPLVRRRFTAAVRNVEFPMYLSGTELAIFDEFYETTLAHGAQRFQWTDPRTDALVQYRFVEPPKWASLRGGGPADRLWMATFKLEIIPGEFEPIIPSVENLAATLTGSASLVAGAVRVRSIAATLLGSSSLSADGTTTAVLDVAATLQGASSLAAQAYAVRSAAAALAGQGTFTATALDSSDIPSVVYDGEQAHQEWTGGTDNAVDGQELFGYAFFTREAEGVRQTIAKGNGSPQWELFIDTDDLLRLVVGAPDTAGTGGAICSNALATALDADDGVITALYGINGNVSTLSATRENTTPGTPLTGTNTPGTAANIEFTADFFIGQNGNANPDLADWFQGLLHGAGLGYFYRDATDGDIIEQFVDTSTGLPRDPGADGSNYLDSEETWEIVLKGHASSHNVNSGAGGNAEAVGTFADGTSPGTYAADFSGRDGLAVLGEAAGWIEADDASNTVVSTAFSQITDLTGNGNHFVQATAGNRPAQGTSGGITLAEFDGSTTGGDDFMLLDSPTADFANAHNAGGSTIAVFRADSRGESGFGAVFRVGVTERLQVNSPGVPHDVFRIQYGCDMSTTDPVFRKTTGVANGTLVLVELYYDKSSNDPSTARMFVNGVELSTSSGVDSTSSAGTPVDDSASDAYLGNDSANSQTLDGGIGMLARWPTILSAADKLLVRNHLATKYGITLP